MNKSARKEQLADVSINLNHDQPLFAPLDNEFFKSGPVEFIEKRNLLEALNDYLSFKELIERHLANSESFKSKFVYKINSPDKDDENQRRDL